MIPTTIRINPPPFWMSRLPFICRILIIIGFFPSMAASAPEWKEVFDPLVVRTLHLELDPADWDRVRFDQPVEGETESIERANAWFHGEGESPIQVTIRRKGATDPALPSDGDPQKVSLKIDINELVPGQRWHGLRKLSLENGGDAGPLNEGFAWQIHRMAGDAGFYRYDAANAAWVRLYINGSYKGVFVSTEQRDEQFLRNRDLYSPSNTWLYKVDGSTYNEVGEGNSPTKTHLNFSPFSSGPGGGPNGGGGTQPDLEIDLPQWIDMESMLAMAACEAFVENNDGLFTHSGKNSFAADFNPPDLRRRLYFPWDMDASIKQGSSQIYGNGAYQTQILAHPWFSRIYEHTFHELLSGKLSEAELHAFLDQLEAVLGPVLDSDPYAAPAEGAANAFAALRDWATVRSASVSSMLTRPFVPRPVFNQSGGEVVSGFGLTMSAATGQVYFTTDGTDPRGVAGVVGASAQPYNGPLVIDGTTKVIARGFDGTNWSGLATEATFNVSAYATAMRVTEIMYHPAANDPPDATDKDAFEFIELRNTGATDLDLSDFFFEGISYAFPPGSIVSADETIVLVRDASAFATRYPGVAYDGIYLGSLNNSGEKIRLKNADGTTVISVEYDDDPPWPLSPDGLGYSLVNRNPDGNPDDAGNWRASTNLHGSPGVTDPAAEYALDVVLNEVLANSEAPYEDAVEIHNAGSSNADLGGWFLSNEARNASGALDPLLLKKFQLPAGTMIPASGHAAFYEEDFNILNSLIPFDFSPYGGRVYLSSADESGELTGLIIALDFPATDPNTSFGRIESSVGDQNGRLAAPTFGVDGPTSVEDFRSGNGAPNSPALVGPVVISEIMYNPLESGSEFIELHNLSGQEVDISGWDIDGIADFAFPSGTTIPGGGFVVLVDTAKTTPEDFRAAFGVPLTVEVFGWLFDLGNAGESLRLDKPNTDSMQPDILLERVRYNDKAPWPTEADGAGPSLERHPAGGFGNDPLHWRAVTIHGTPGRAGSFAFGIAISKGSFWNFKATASTLGTVWKEAGYNASGWSEADGPAGYGEAFIASVLPFGDDPQNKHPTTYFRKSFVINEDPAEINGLGFSLLYDDGVVVYLNGTEVLRRGLPEGGVSYETLAADREAGAYEVVDLTPFTTLLVQGTNVLAVEVHQSDPGSADLVWDARLTYTTSAADPNDMDGDRLPGDWEISNGFDDSDPSDALLDTDGDGRDNFAEYLAGSDPRDPSSFFRVGTVETTPSGGFLLRWNSVLGRTYQVSYSNDLMNWFGFGAAGSVTATGPVTEFTDPSASLPERRYYRISIEP